MIVSLLALVWNNSRGRTVTAVGKRKKTKAKNWCYLVQRRTNSINPLQLKPRQLVLPVPIKDGLKRRSWNVLIPSFVKDKQRNVNLLEASNFCFGLKKDSALRSWSNWVYFTSIFLFHLILLQPELKRLHWGCASEIVTGLQLRS